MNPDLRVVRVVHCNGQDIELWERGMMHGCWSVGIESIDPEFWLHVGAWLQHGTPAVLRALLHGRWAEGTSSQERTAG